MDGITGKGKGQQPAVSSGMLLDELDYKIKELLENKRKKSSGVFSFVALALLLFMTHTCSHTAHGSTLPSKAISQYGGALSLPKMGEVQKPSLPQCGMEQRAYAI